MTSSLRDGHRRRARSFSLAFLLFCFSWSFYIRSQIPLLAFAFAVFEGAFFSNKGDFATGRPTEAVEEDTRLISASSSIPVPCDL